MNVGVVYVHVYVPACLPARMLRAQNSLCVLLCHPLPYSFGGEDPAEPEVSVLPLGWQPASPSDAPSSTLLGAGLQACTGCWVWNSGLYA